MLIIASIFFSSANSCPDQDLRKGHPLEKTLRQPRDQNSTGFCFAFSSSDLLTYKYNKNISPFYLSQLFNKAFPDHVPNTVYNPMYGGSMKAALESAKKYPNCLESAVPSNNNHFGSNPESFKKTLEQYRFFQVKLAKSIGIKTLLDDIPSQSDLNGSYESSSEVVHSNLAPNVPRERIVKDEAAALQNFFDNASNADKLEIFNQGYPNFIHDLLSKQCDAKKGKVSLNNFETDGIFVEGNEKIGLEYGYGLDPESAERKNYKKIPTITKENLPGKIQELLSANSKKPVGISYDGSKFRPEGGPHASTIWGTTFKNNQCYFIVKDSFGKGCSLYNPAVKARCNAKEGTFLMSFEEARESIFNIDYIK